MGRTRGIRELLESRRGLVIPGCFDPLSARLIEAAGFTAAYVSGFAVNAAMGAADLGTTGPERMASRAREIVAAVELPIFVDGDDGYGGPPEAAVCVRRLEAAGAVGVNIDDTLSPRPGDGKALVPISTMQEKIAAARYARADEGFMVLGRTDAMATHGVAEATKRAKALEEAGADAVMVMYLTEPEQVRALASELKAPLVIAVTETARKSFSAKDLAGAGHAATVYPVTSLLAGLAAQAKALGHLAEVGDTQVLEPSLMPMAQVRTLTERRKDVRNAT
jgi:methylisocitrate lyase